jgi:hypothetical protein
MTLILLALLTATAAAETLPACWTPSDLAQRKGEEVVQKGVKRALLRRNARSPTIRRSRNAVPCGA